jgi:hypothetical protein
MVKLTPVLIPQLEGMPKEELKVTNCVFDITNETVISYDLEGNMLSKYGADSWRFEYERDTLIINFDNKDWVVNNSQRGQIKQELKAIQFVVMHCPGSYKQQKSGFSRHKSVNAALIALVSIGLKKELDFKLFFTGKHNHYLHETLSKSHWIGLQAIINALAYLNSANIDLFNNILTMNKAFTGFVKQKTKKQLQEQQTMAIPERIYLLALDKIESDINNIDTKLLDDAISELKKNAENPIYGVLKRLQPELLKKHFPDKYQAILDKHGWKRISSNYDYGVEHLDNAISLQAVMKRIPKEVEIENIAALSRLLAYVAAICFRALIIYSGGRFTDIAYLPANGFKVHKVGKKSYPLLYGEVQKGKQVDRDVEFWVTNQTGEKAFNLAKKISDFVYDTATNNKYKSVPMDKRLLFPSPSLAKKQNGKHKVRFFAKCFPNFRVDGVEITEKDKLELMLVDPSIDLDRKDVQEGFSWQFKSHQFRRSLAVYAQSSGAVSLPALRRQLRHLGEAITLFYSGGSCAASNIIDMKNSFAKECKERKSAATAIALHKFVVSDEKIFGGMGRHLDKNTDLKNIILDQDITETQKMVERGELAYHETALGGCGEIGNCDYRPFAFIDTTHCVSCDKSYHKVSKLNKAIEVYTVALEDIPCNTVDYKWRDKQIKELKQVRDSHLVEQEKEQANV